MGAGWLAGGRVHGQVGWGWGGIVEKDEEAWAVVLLGLGLLLGLLGGSLHLRDKADRPGSSLDLPADHADDRVQNISCGSPGGLPTSLVLASPFSEWFSSFASASAFSFAFLVFLSSFLSFTAFSFCSGEKTGGILTVPPAWRYQINQDQRLSYLCCLLGLWFRLGLGRFLRKEKGE